jgi:hypothetical protein
MKTIKNNYTNFILTVIAVTMLGILFKGNIITAAQAGTFDVSIFDLELTRNGSDREDLHRHHHKIGYLIEQACGG